MPVDTSLCRHLFRPGASEVKTRFILASSAILISRLYSTPIGFELMNRIII